MDASSRSARRPPTSARATSSSTTAWSPRSGRGSAPATPSRSTRPTRSSCRASSTPTGMPGGRSSGTSASCRRAAGPEGSLGDRFRPEDVYAATLIGLLGAIEAGITTVVDWSPIRLGRRLVDAALQAHADAGLRTVFVHAARTGTEEHGRPRRRSGELVTRIGAAAALYDDRVRIRRARCERPRTGRGGLGRGP